MSGTREAEESQELTVKQLAILAGGHVDLLYERGYTGVMDHPTVNVAAKIAKARGLLYRIRTWPQAGTTCYALVDQRRAVVARLKGGYPKPGGRGGREPASAPPA